MNIIFMLIGSLIGCFVVYFYYKPKLAAKVEQDTTLLKEKEETETALKALNKEQEVASAIFNSLNARITTAKAELNSLNENIKTATEQFHSLSISVEETTNSLYEQSKQAAEAKIKILQLLLQRTYEEKKQQLNAEYELKKNENVEKEAAMQQNIEKTENKLNELTSKVHNALEAARRQEELESNLDFYRLQLSNIDIEEIKKIRSIIPYLRDTESVNKVIWKVYYERACTDLISRVIGAGTHSGIYKITNIQNQRCYVGQSVNLSERWKQHIKRGIGAESPTHNKLYSVMAEKGPENFTFEILEECSKEQLNEREKFWGNYFQATSFGYSEKLG